MAVLTTGNALLTPTQRKMITMYLADVLPISEIYPKLGLTRGAADMKMHRAVGAIRDQNPLLDGNDVRPGTGAGTDPANLEARPRAAPVHGLVR